MSSIGPIGPNGPEGANIRPSTEGVSGQSIGQVKGPGGFETPPETSTPVGDGDPTLRLADSLRAQGLTPEAAMGATVKVELEQLTGGSVPRHVVDKIVERLRDDPSMASMARRIFGTNES